MFWTTSGNVFWLDPSAWVVMLELLVVPTGPGPLVAYFCVGFGSPRVAPLEGGSVRHSWRTPDDAKLPP